MKDKKVSDNKDKIEDQYIATMVLHAVGDTIGFNNGIWDSNYMNNKSDIYTTFEMVSQFIALGGVNGIDLSKWNTSDDTFFHIAMAKALLEFNGKITEEHLNIVKNEIIAAYKQLVVDQTKNGIIRNPANSMTRAIKKIINDKTDGRQYNYDPLSGGNACAMRSLCIGLAFNGKKNRQKLIDYSIITGMLTHNSPMGFLAGLAISLFVAYAIEGIEIKKWPFLMLEALESQDVKKHINRDNDDIFFDYRNFIKFWKIYLETRFNEKEPDDAKSHTNLFYRPRYYMENFLDNEGRLGGSGYGLTIIAYNALLDCGGKWEKMVFYSILIPGDHDTLGSVSCGLYGAVYGFGDVPLNNYENVEQKNNLISYGKQLFKKYYKK